MQPDLEPQHALGRRLRGLSDAAAPPYDWREFQRRCDECARTRHRLAGGRVAAAAAGVVALGVLAVWIRLGGGPTRPAPPQAMPPRGAPSEFLAVDTAPPRAAAERWLESLPSEPAVVRVGTHAAVTGLEDRIAQLDDLLSEVRLDQAPLARLVALQQERTRLVGTLAQVRYAEELADEWR
ncbi:MAG: hypothetical protein E6K22_13345 [Gammaproteobacteria bacterium]|nr:MAG: hypothetical protein E6K22_13345 [Gammaproteobacteria bacterium]TLZ58912.1 MAG: hypothetical protein E6K20_17030 [Gammaproteobacteria bacterium]